jgi:hypothetical protein
MEYGTCYCALSNVRKIYIFRIHVFIVYDTCMHVHTYILYPMFFRSKYRKKHSVKAATYVPLKFVVQNIFDEHHKQKRGFVAFQLTARFRD